MIRPLDIQVAWKAVPLQANRVLQEQASILYRSVQDLNESYSRNLRQAEAITKITEAAAKLLSPIQKSDINANYRMEELKQRSKERRNKEKLYTLYAPRQNKGKYFSSSSSSYGDLLNLKG